MTTPTNICCHGRQHPSGGFPEAPGGRRGGWTCIGVFAPRLTPHPQLPHTGDRASVPGYTRHGSRPCEVGEPRGSPAPSQPRPKEPGLAWGPGAPSQLPAIPRHPPPLPSSSDFCIGPRVTQGEERDRSRGRRCQARSRLPAVENHRRRTEGSPHVATGRPPPRASVQTARSARISPVCGTEVDSLPQRPNDTHKHPQRPTRGSGITADPWAPPRDGAPPSLSHDRRLCLVSPD